VPETAAGEDLSGICTLAAIADNLVAVCGRCYQGLKYGVAVIALIFINGHSSALLFVSFL
jgi:hypothetical protein